MNAWSVLRLLRRTHEEIVKRTAPRLHAHGLSPRSLVALNLIQARPYSTDLSREMDLPPPSVSRMLKDLEAAGYLVRRVEREDLRRYHFDLTEAGRQVLAQARADAEAAVREMLARLGPEDADTFEGLLRRLHPQVAGAGTRPPDEQETDHSEAGGQR